MNFVRDILLIYNHDNDAIAGKNGIWKDNFVNFLKYSVAKLIDKNIGVEMINIQDNKLNKDLIGSKLIILLVDDPFLESNISDQNLRVFSKFKESQSLEIPFASWIFPVIASNLPREMYPVSIKDLIGYDFTSVRMREKMIKEKEGSPGHSKSLQTLWLKIFDLVNDLKISLNNIELNGSRRMSKQKTIYLAQTVPELIDVRDNIKRDLIRHGYGIFPDQLLLPQNKNIESSINQMLSRCQMSIHLIGESYGERYMEDKSIVEIQHKIAEDHSARINNSQSKNKFYRIIWLNPEMEDISEAQKLFTSKIKRDIESKEESELVQSPIEELKKFIKSKLSQFQENQNYQAVTKVDFNKATKNSVYLIYDRKDYDLSEGIKQQLIKNGFEVLIPAFDGTIFELENLHRDNLITCDGCMVIADKASEKWLVTKLKDIDKALGFGRMKPIKAKAVYTTTKENKNKRIAVNNGTIVINYQGQINKKVLEPFLDKFITENE